MRVIGFDPGIATVGFAVVDEDSLGIHLVAFGCIKTTPDNDLGYRLNVIRKDAQELITTYKPEYAGIEELFFVKNHKTAMMVAHGRGVLLQLLSENDIGYTSFTPLQVKQSVTGYGSATKSQVQIMVQKILKVTTPIASDDAADAVAVALCALRCYH